MRAIDTYCVKVNPSHLLRRDYANRINVGTSQNNLKIFLNGTAVLNL